MSDLDIHTAALKPVLQQITAAYSDFTSTGDDGIQVLVRQNARDISSAVGGLGDSGTALVNYHAEVFDSIGNLLTMAISELHSVNNTLDATITKVDGHESDRASSAAAVGGNSGSQG